MERTSFTQKGCQGSPVHGVKGVAAIEDNSDDGIVEVGLGCRNPSLRESVEQVNHVSSTIWNAAPKLKYIRSGALKVSMKLRAVVAM